MDRQRSIQFGFTVYCSLLATEKLCRTVNCHELVSHVCSALAYKLCVWFACMNHGKCHGSWHVGDTPIRNNAHIYICAEPRNSAHITFQIRNICRCIHIATLTICGHNTVMACAGTLWTFDILCRLARISKHFLRGMCHRVCLIWVCVCLPHTERTNTTYSMSIVLLSNFCRKNEYFSKLNMHLFAYCFTRNCFRWHSVDAKWHQWMRRATAYFRFWFIKFSDRIFDLVNFRTRAISILSNMISLADTHLFVTHTQLIFLMNFVDLCRHVETRKGACQYSIYSLILRWTRREYFRNCTNPVSFFRKVCGSYLIFRFRTNVPSSLQPNDVR